MYVLKESSYITFAWEELSRAGLTAASSFDPNDYGPPLPLTSTEDEKRKREEVKKISEEVKKSEASP